MAERAAVQNPMLKYADEIGWESISRLEAAQKRGNNTGLYFIDVLKAQLLKFNRGLLDASLCGEIVRQLNHLRPTLEGNQDALSRLRGEESVFVPDEDRYRNVTLIDLRTPTITYFT